MKNYRFGTPAPFPLLVIFMFMMVVSMFGQSDSSSLSGTVTDASGAVVIDAKVAVRNAATSAERSITTNEGGGFTVTNLASGDYSVRVEKSGFETTTLSDVHLDPSIGRRIDVAMKIGNTTTEVTVQAGVNTVQTESGSVGQLITQEQVKNIQLNGRNPLYLAQMEPVSCATTPWRPSASALITLSM